MRLFVPVHGVAPGHVGSEDYNHAIIGGLAARGHEVTAFGPGAAPDTVPPGVEWRTCRPAPPALPLLWRAADYLTVRHIVREIRLLGPPRYDVIVSALLPGLWGAHRAWPHLPRVYIPQSPIAAIEIEARGGARTHRAVGRWSYGRLQRWAWKNAEVVVSYTPTITAFRAAHYAALPRNLVNSWPGVDLDRFRPAVREPALLAALSIPAHAPLVVSFCRLIPHKEVDFLLRAVARPTVPRETYLLVLGDGPERPRLEALARSLRIADRTRFAGYQADVERFLALGDIYVLPSRIDSFGFTLAQALATGLPAIARRARYPRVLTPFADVIEEERTGFLVDSEEELAARLAWLLEDEWRRRAMGEAARRSAVARFGWQRHFDALDAAVRLAARVSGPMPQA